MVNGNPKPDDKELIPEERSKDRTKEPYVKPSFRFEQVFVTSALSCGKIDPTSTHCHFNRKVS
jgi:hypothetical protein